MINSLTLTFALAWVHRVFQIASKKFQRIITKLIYCDIFYYSEKVVKLDIYRAQIRVNEKMTPNLASDETFSKNETDVHLSQRNMAEKIINFIMEKNFATKVRKNQFHNAKNSSKLMIFCQKNLLFLDRNYRNNPSGHLCSFSTTIQTNMQKKNDSRAR